MAFISGVPNVDGWEKLMEGGKWGGGGGGVRTRISVHWLLASPCQQQQREPARDMALMNGFPVV